METKLLRELCVEIVDCPHSTPSWTSAGKIVIRNFNIQNGKIDFSNPSFTDQEHYLHRIKRAKPEGGDLVITREAPMGQVGMIPSNVECCLGQRMVLLKVDRTVCNPYYLLYALQSPAVQFQIKCNEGTGTTVSNLRIPILEQLEIPFVNKENQDRIAAFLKLIDDKIDINKKIIKNLENQLVCLFNEKCTTKGQLSSSVVQSLSDIATFTNGLAMQKFPPESDSQFLRVLKIKELRQGYLDESSDKCSTNIEEKFKVNDGDVIFSWSGSLMVDLWTGGVCGLNQHLFKVTSDLYPKWFVYMWVKHHVSDFAAIAAAKATTMGHIKRGDLDKAQVVVPNDECMKTLTKIFDPLLGLLIATKIQNKKLSKIRDMLLPKLISGEIELKNQ